MHRVRLLQHHGVVPYIVFDGDYLPSKAITEKDRAKKREDSKKLGLQLQRAGKVSQAYLELQKAIDVTPEMARQFIEELKKAGIQYVVAPYEADAQLVYLERQGIISAILSDDSDLLVFGAKCLLTKLEQYGDCIEINKSDFCACKEVSLTGFSDVEFRQMAILSGCDYLKSINGMGLKTAHRLVRKHKTVEKVVRMLQFDGKFSVPKNYLEEFRQADRTFLHQWVFCPNNNKLVLHTEPFEPLDPATMPYIGAYVAPDIAQKIARGDLNPITKNPIIMAPYMNTSSFATPRAPLISRQNSQRLAASGHKNHGSIEKFLQPKRIPLGEMSPNDFTHSPSQQAVLRRNSGNSWESVPVPESENSSIARSSPPIQLPRRYLADWEIQPGPTTHDPSPSRPLSRGRSISTSIGVADLRLAKRARLGDEVPSESSAPQTPSERSRFFTKVSRATPPSGKGSKARRRMNNTEIDIFSDDSLEEALANMPDEVLQAEVPKQKRGLGLVVYRDGEMNDVPAQASSSGESGSQVLPSIENSQTSVLSLTQPSSSASTVQAPPTPVDTPTASLPKMIKSSSFGSTVQAPPTPIDTPTSSFAATAIENFSFTPTPAVSSKAAARAVFFNGLPTPQTGPSKTIRKANSTNGAISGTPLNKGIPSALQRLGARALNSGNGPPGTPYLSPTIFKKPLAKKGVPFPEVARAKHQVSVEAAQIPLPAADQEEVLALSKVAAETKPSIRGSEDLIIHDSEDEEENEGRKVDLARFAFSG